MCVFVYVCIYACMHMCVHMIHVGVGGGGLLGRVGAAVDPAGLQGDARQGGRGAVVASGVGGAAGAFERRQCCRMGGT